MNFTKVIGLIALIFIFACAGSSEKSGTEQSTEKNVTSNQNDIWTGTWQVTGLADIVSPGQEKVSILKLKQNVNKVISTQGSEYDFRGKCSGNQLKGSWADGHNVDHRLNVTMSEDLKSFEGVDRIDTVTRHVSGVRQE